VHRGEAGREDGKERWQVGPTAAAALGNRPRARQARQNGAAGRAAHACVGRPGHSDARHGGGSSWRARTHERGERAGARRAGPRKGLRVGGTRAGLGRWAGMRGREGGPGGPRAPGGPWGGGWARGEQARSGRWATRETGRGRWLLWGTDIPGSTRRLEGLAKYSGPITLQGHPFVGQGRNHWQNGSTQDWIDSSLDSSLGLNIICSIEPIHPHSTLRRRN
jgi:hypothetical protein